MLLPSTKARLHVVLSAALRQQPREVGDQEISALKERERRRPRCSDEQSEQHPNPSCTPHISKRTRVQGVCRRSASGWQSGLQPDSPGLWAMQDAETSSRAAACSSRAAACSLPPGNSDRDAGASPVWPSCWPARRGPATHISGQNLEANSLQLLGQQLPLPVKQRPQAEVEAALLVQAVRNRSLQHRKGGPWLRGALASRERGSQTSGWLGATNAAAQRSAGLDGSECDWAEAACQTCHGTLLLACSTQRDAQAVCMREPLRQLRRAPAATPPTGSRLLPPGGNTRRCVPPPLPTWSEEGTVKVMNWCALATAATMSGGPVSHPTCNNRPRRCR